MNYTSLNEAYELNENIDTDYNIIDDNLNIYDNNNNNNNTNNNNDTNNNNTNNDTKNDNNNTIDAKKLLKDYKNLNKLLNENKLISINLDKQKEDIINYKCNIYNKHQNVMIQLCRETTDIIETAEMSEHIIKYIELFKIYADKWIKDYYTIKKNKLMEDIEKQEIKLTAYRNLFINTTKEIIPLEKTSKNICPICFENEINMCAIPCGHTCCNECIIQSLKYHNTRLTKCLSCRNTLKEYIKLFIQL